MVALVTPLAHIGHWYHVLLYLAPVLLVGGGLWYAGKQLPDEDDLTEADDVGDPDDGRDVGHHAGS